jgi:selenide,water dikinase
MHSPLPLTRDLVFVGGGHSHALVLRRWAMKPLPGVRLTLINPGPTAAYSGMLPGFVAGHYPREALEMDLVRLARAAGARLILDRAVGIDRDARRIHLAGRPPVAYDIAALDVGITSEMPQLPGFAAHAVPAKPLNAFADRWTRFVAAVEAGEARPRVLVLGAGVAGAELAMACAHRLGPGAEVTLLDRSAALPGLPPGTRVALKDALREAGVTLREHAEVTRIEAGAALLADGTRATADLIIGAAGALAQGWLASTGLDLHEGFVTVDPFLRSSDPAIYAAGDCAHLGFAPRPKAGVFAVREAPILFHNLRADLTGAQRRAYRPQKDYLKLISLGGQRALADKAGLRTAGHWLWRWKDRIDRAFMEKFHDLPKMTSPALPRELAAGVRAELGDKPLCGGCGAKVGSDDLEAALSVLPASERPDVLSRAGDDAAILTHGAGVQVISTDHLRGFTEDPWQLARLAAIHALGDIWAMGADPQVALSTVILPRMSARMQAETLREITSAAAVVFRAAGADVVGGHTTLGAELTVGFTITGLAPRAIEQGGGQPDDLLVLTKPLGTGVLLAAEMQGRAPGDRIAALYTAMAQPLSEAARVLAPHAHAMTDVTGFGLAGHLSRLCAASGTGAEIDLDAVPFHPGALGLASQGIGSTLYPANRAAVPDLPDTDPRARLLFDPQTCGGLLAAIPRSAWPAIEAALPQARVIGRLSRAPGLRLR